MRPRQLDRWRLNVRRVYTKKGDVFSVKTSDTTKKYFQYIASDLTQLNSSVIRAFKEEYPIDAAPDLAEVVKGDVDFYVHCVLNWGLKMGLWEKVGNVPAVGKIDHIMFRQEEDEPGTKISYKWYVWRINEEMKFVGKLKGDYQKAEIGDVMPPHSIVQRMQTGDYGFVFPDFE